MDNTKAWETKQDKATVAVEKKEVLSIWKHVSSLNIKNCTDIAEKVISSDYFLQIFGH